LGDTAAEDEVAMVSHRPEDLQNINLNRPMGGGWQDSIKESFVKNDLAFEEVKGTGYITGGTFEFQRDQ
jgi:hypothetical protein